MCVSVCVCCFYHVRRFERPDELAGLLVVGVSGEGDVVDRHLERKLLSRHGGDLIRLRHDVLQHTHTHILHTYTNVYCSGEDLKEVLRTVEVELFQLKKWFDINKLSLNEKKQNVWCLAVLGPIVK